jgi:hypothetical protein
MEKGGMIKMVNEIRSVIIKGNFLIKVVAEF